MMTPAQTADERGFALDARLREDTVPILTIGLCTLLLKNDARWPWLILVPQRPGIREIHELTPLDQAMLSFETSMVSEMLARLTGCHKINTGALGNVVPQLHVHVVARERNDPAWPGPVWGHGAAVAYDPEDSARLISAVRRAL